MSYQGGSVRICYVSFDTNIHQLIEDLVTHNVFSQTRAMEDLSVKIDKLIYLNEETLQDLEIQIGKAIKDESIDMENISINDGKIQMRV